MCRTVRRSCLILRIFGEDGKTASARRRDGICRTEKKRLREQAASHVFLQELSDKNIKAYILHTRKAEDQMYPNMKLDGYTFWFIPGTQPLYGKEVIDEVNRHARIIADGLDASDKIPCPILCKPAVHDEKSILKTLMDANMDESCAGVITWMHTFSPAKRWVEGLRILDKPMLHLNTQFNQEIPWDKIDMDFMNLNQSAHGDREFGFIGARMRLPRKIVAGYWEDEKTRERIGHWMRSAIGAVASRSLKACTFGSNMREVAVTCGDRVEAQMKLGWAVNPYGIGDLISLVEKVTDDEVKKQMDQYDERYQMATDNIDAVRYQARIEVALRQMLERIGATAFTDTFEDLQQLEQLPGLAVQNLMRDGFGFAGEGDWKTACLDRIMKLMGSGLPGGAAFMEDYTYHMEPGREAVLGAHMIEVDPAIASDRPQIEVHPLGIGDRGDPARVTFHAIAGPAIVATLVDMGDRFRMIVNDVDGIAPYEDMPNLPVARVMWRPKPSLSTSAEAWILAGGAHHTVLSFQLDAEHIMDMCNILGIECIHIGEKTEIEEFERQLIVNDIVWKLK